MRRSIESTGGLGRDRHLPMAQSQVQPWGGIAFADLPSSAEQRSHEAAVRSPCETCATAACCWYVPLGGFRTSTVFDLNYATYLLNFERIELGLAPSGDWSVAYRYPCRHLDRATLACSVHGQAEQPHVCRTYNPYKCWYKAVLNQPVSPRLLRIDRTRLQHVIAALSFDEHGNIVNEVEWDALLPQLAHVHDAVPEQSSEPAPFPEAVPPVEPQKGYSFAQVQNACDGCAAYCCKVLMFPMPPPTDIGAVDYLRYCLGFPGIRLGIMNEEWALLVETRCRHLEQDRCSVFGQPERPLVCTYYDQVHCTYKRNFERAEQAGFLRVNLEQYEGLLPLLRFDAAGALEDIPDVERLRAAVVTA